LSLFAAQEIDLCPAFIDFLAHCSAGLPARAALYITGPFGIIGDFLLDSETAGVFLLVENVFALSQCVPAVGFCLVLASEEQKLATLLAVRLSTVGLIVAGLVLLALALITLSLLIVIVIVIILFGLRLACVLFGEGDRRTKRCEGQGKC